MPTLRMAAIPPPGDWKEFEQMTRDAFAVKWHSPNLQLNGRQGQAQHGVDIWGPDYLERQIGLQCKRIEDPLDIGTINDEVAKAEKFTPTISAFYLVTTTPTDAKLQIAVRKVSAERLALLRFPVGIFFWEDVLRELTANPNLFRQFYPDFANPTEILVVGGASDLALLDIAYHGTRLDEYLKLLFGEFHMLEDRNQIIQLTKMVELCALQIMAGPIRDELVCDLRDVARNTHRALTEDEKYWNEVQRSVVSAQTTIKGLEYHLKERDLTLFWFGRFMAAWDRDSNKPLGETNKVEFERAIRSLLDAVDADTVMEKVEEFKPNESFVATAIPHEIFGFVRSRVGSALRVASFGS